jgi:hypothetical protein
MKQYIDVFLNIYFNMMVSDLTNWFIWKKIQDDIYAIEDIALLIPAQFKKYESAFLCFMSYIHKCSYEKGQIFPKIPFLK